VLRNTQPAVVRALVGLKALPIATRIEIAERAEALAIIEATKLRRSLSRGVARGCRAAGRRSRAAPAWSRRHAMRRTRRRWVNSIAAAYGEARGSPLFPHHCAGERRRLINLPAQPQFANVAQEAMRGFLLLGAKLQAQAWIRLALGAVTNNARAIIALDRLVPLAAIAGLDEPSASRSARSIAGTR
jgi:hypothetical protein